MRKSGKHFEYTTIPDAGESYKDILSKDKPFTRAMRRRFDEPTDSEGKEQHAPGKEPSMGHPKDVNKIKRDMGETEKDIGTKEAYVIGFHAGCADRGVDPEQLLKSAAGRIISMKQLGTAMKRAFSSKSGRIKTPMRAITRLENSGVPAEIMLNKPGKNIVTSEKSTRQYLAKLLRDGYGK